MSRKNTIENRIVDSLQCKNVIPYHPELAVICNGDPRDAIVLRQLIFWCARGTDDWAFESGEDLAQQLGMTRNMIRRSIKNLEDFGYIESKLGVAKGHCTKFYKIKEDEIKQALVQTNHLR